MKTELLTSVEDFCCTILKNRLDPQLHFHNLQHTQMVVAAVKEIGQQSNLSPQEQETVSIAAWFHDVGYCKTYKGHELESADHAFIFLNIIGMDPQRIQQVMCAILSTRMPQQPRFLLDKILCDADLYHLSVDRYQQVAANLREEWDQKLGLYYTDHEWNRLNYNMMKDHQYWTPYGKTTLQLLKENNMQRLNKEM